MLDSDTKEIPMRDLTDLSHHSVPLGDGGEVLILDTGAVIGPESQAMLGALHSRSPGGIRSHLEVLAKKGPENFMATYYVGYGHQSIGDLGAASVFIEGVSMLAAKAVQDFPLYNGQEVSTRYVDFSMQRFVDPVGTSASRAVLETWRTFYLEGLATMIEVLKERYPFDPEADKNEKVWEKAIKARAFDTMRSFLPAGASTNLVWFGELRQLFDRLPQLRHHPLEEVRQVAEAAERGLLVAYPSSFSEKRYEKTEEYLELVEGEYAYFDIENPADFAFADQISRERLAAYRTALERRPPKANLPYAIREAGTSEVEFLLDFGSFRDIQRHRAVAMRMPLLTDAHGFESWYLDELTDDLRTRAIELLERQRVATDALGLTPHLKQYYLPMGYRVVVRFSGDLRALVYLTEIRASSTVHPTLSRRAVQMGDALEQAYASGGLALHMDRNPGRFDVKRGTHDIVSKT